MLIPQPAISGKRMKTRKIPELAIKSKPFSKHHCIAWSPSHIHPIKQTNNLAQTHIKFIFFLVPTSFLWLTQKTKRAELKSSTQQNQQDRSFSIFWVTKWKIGKLKERAPCSSNQAATLGEGGGWHGGRGGEKPQWRRDYGVWVRGLPATRSTTSVAAKLNPTFPSPSLSTVSVCQFQIGLTHTFFS